MYPPNIKNKKQEMNPNAPAWEPSAEAGVTRDAAAPCPICLEPLLTQRQSHRLWICGHTACRTCLREWLEWCERSLGLAEGETSCPQCRTVIHPEDIRRVLGRSLRPTARPRLAEEEEEMDELTRDWLREHGIWPCPWCGMGVERNGGCDHMACFCGENFCFGCGKKYLPREVEWICHSCTATSGQENMIDKWCNCRKHYAMDDRVCAVCHETICSDCDKKCILEEDWICYSCLLSTGEQENSDEVCCCDTGVRTCTVCSGTFCLVCGKEEMRLWDDWWFCNSCQFTIRTGEDNVDRWCCCYDLGRCNCTRTTTAMMREEERMDSARFL